MIRLSHRKSIAQQFVAFRKDYPHFKARIFRNRLIVKGELRPTARSSSYRFLLRYSLWSTPKIRIVSPKLSRNSKNEPIPHMYFQKRLCLYQPKYREFRSSDLLSKTIIPWSSLWLYYYELWHITCEWLGGGEHPKAK